MQCGCQLSGKFIVVDDSRGYTIDRSTYPRGIEGMPYNPNNVVNVNPGKPLLSAAEPSSKSQPKQRQHLFERTTSGTQYNPYSHFRNSQPQLPRSVCLKFPVPTNVT